VASVDTKWIDRGISAGMVLAIVALLYVLHRIFLYWGWVYPALQGIPEAARTLWRGIG
jgi:hypothetical protein